VGDYLLAKGLLLSLDHGDFRILQLLSGAVRKMSEGELLQIEKARSLNLDETVYFEIIRNKTASLLASSCAAGAYSSSGNEQLSEKMSRFGEAVGIAFQIKDDLFDYGNEETGKPSGNDLKEKKLTLPLIHTLNTAEKSLRRELIYIIKNQNRNPEKIKYVTGKVVEAGGIRYATEKMNQYRDAALTILYEFEDSEVRKGLEELVRFTTDRKY
jgi:octaprenyl-diphosphate synthase